jgi:beta-glucanase (GH16 family)
MALLKLRLATKKLFGRFPKTEEFEARDKALREEYSEYINFDKTQDYTHFIDLKSYVESGEPQRIKEELRLLKYDNSVEQQKELEFKKLEKDKTLSNYFRIKDSETLNLFQAVELTGKPTRIKELQDIVESLDYKSKRREHKKNNSNEYQNELEYSKLRKDKELNRYFKLKNSKEIKDYFALNGSDKVERYHELKAFVHSNEFIERKTYLLSKNKFEKTEAFQKLAEYDNLKKSAKIVWYHKLANTNKFDDVKSWELTFSDNFEGQNLDASKWIPRYFWGEALLNNSYSLSADKHFYTDGKNIEIKNGILKISTKKEKADGLAWDLKYGFLNKTFDYTSGIICTGQTFRQMYGRFEAKVRFTKAPGIYHAFWLVGDKMLPHINVFRQDGKNGSSVQGSTYIEKANSSKLSVTKTSLSGFDFGANFYVLSIDWTPTKMVWKINGVPYMESDRDLPNMPAYLVISSGVIGNTADISLPSTLEVDWVRCWKSIESNN